MTSVQVAVRVRPFNGREKERNSTLIVRMDGMETVLIDKEQNNKERKFNFDKAYWSHDAFTEDPETKYLTPDPGGPYTD